MAKGTVKLREFTIFCYVCKKPITVKAEDEKQATSIFRKEGHSDDKVPALAPNLGRKSRRFDKAIAGHNARILAAKERQRKESEERAKQKEKVGV